MNNELNQIVKVLSDIKKELRTQNILLAMEYCRQHGPILFQQDEIKDFLANLLKRAKE